MPSSPPTAAWRPGGRSSSPSATSVGPRPDRVWHSRRRSGRRRRSPLPPGSTTPPRSRAPGRASPSSAASTTTASRSRPALDDARAPRAPRRLLPGRSGRLRPAPRPVFPLLRERGVPSSRATTISRSATGLADCGCGYTDPRDNHFARISYDYTRAQHLDGLQRLAARAARRRRVRAGAAARAAGPRLAAPGERVPVGVDLARCLPAAPARRSTEADVHARARTPGSRGTAASPTGGSSSTSAPSAAPPTTAAPTSGTRCSSARAADLGVELVPRRLRSRAARRRDARRGAAGGVRRDIQTGWWTTCLEILPARERAASRF